ncbi:succinate-semialdehyde dehydrogenase [NADP(+)] isoform X2 [Leptinotarsa decemlineata]|uniref:succinate-semialdehyde dehydrogenase [NADP(+)] isoform X2 n=1 Tax=Leptinotarsa decemlineata TaxID=7539 RepID=UPI003D3099FD
MDLLTQLRLNKKQRPIKKEYGFTNGCVQDKKSAALKAALKHFVNQLNGIAVGVFSNDNALTNLGLFLAPALAAGYNIVLQVGTKLAPAAFLIKDLATSVGIPEDAFRLVPSDDCELLPYLSSEKVAVLSLFVDLKSQKYRGINSSGKKILQLSSYKTPVIVFDSADLDSACEGVIASAWGYRSLLPWSTNMILVQENIFPVFLNKLKSKLKSLKIGNSDDKMVDIVWGGESRSSKLSALVDLAESQGVEIFQTEENSNKWCPTLFIGGRVQMNRVLTSDCQEADDVTVLAFRSIDEAVNLANNTRQGLGASIWSENVGVVNEVARKLKVGNVWVNSSYGSSTPAVAICPVKESGVGYFGGKEGFLEYVEPEIQSVNPVRKASSNASISVASIIESARRSQENWSKVPKIEKSKIFQEYAEYLDNQKSNKSNLSDWIVSTIDDIYESLKDSYRETPNLTSSYNLNTLTEPRGVVAIDISQSENRKLIFTALYQGNAVLLFSKSTCSSEFLTKLCSLLPRGVFSIVPYSLEAVKNISVNKCVNVYFGNDINSVFGCLPIAESTVFTKVSDEWSDIHRKVTVLKNIWTDIGKSSSCNLGNY